MKNKIIPEYEINNELKFGVNENFGNSNVFEDHFISMSISNIIEDNFKKVEEVKKKISLNFEKGYEYFSAGNESDVIADDKFEELVYVDSTQRADREDEGENYFRGGVVNELSDQNQNRIQEIQIIAKNNIEPISEESIFEDSIQTQWNLIKQIRKTHKTSMDRIKEILSEVKGESRETYKFQVLVFLILSRRTNILYVEKSIKKFKTFGFNCEKLSTLSDKQMYEIIHSISFQKQKVKDVQRLCKIINETYNGDPPELIDQVKGLPGIGNVMCEIYMNFISDTEKFISVSSHVQRVANRLNWVKSANTIETKKQLESILPKKLWADVNFVIDGFGELICTKSDPKCNLCALKDSCFAKVNKMLSEPKGKKNKKNKNINSVVLECENESGSEIDLMSKQNNKINENISIYFHGLETKNLKIKSANKDEEDNRVNKKKKK